MLNKGFSWNCSKNEEGLILALSNRICKELERSIVQRGKATLLVSGGKTPAGLFEVLSKKNIEWEKVFVGLVDERWVNTRDKESNERLVKEKLLQNNAFHANFFGLIQNTKETRESLCEVEKLYREVFSTVDVTVIGMGVDGHIGSLFSKDDLEAEGVITITESPSPPVRRVSVTKEVIKKSGIIFLFIKGEDKKRSLLHFINRGVDKPIVDLAGEVLVNVYCFS